MNEPVSVPNEPTAPIEQRVKSAQDEGQILDEGLDLSGYRGTHDSPFVADYLGIRDLYKTNNEISQQVDQITQHVIDKTEGQSIVYVVKEMLDQYKDEMNLKEDDSGIYKLKKLLQLIKAREKLSQLEAMRSMAITDIENMV